jgi:hypothetical protein
MCRARTFCGDASGIGQTGARVGALFGPPKLCGRHRPWAWLDRKSDRQCPTRTLALPGAAPASHDGEDADRVPPESRLDAKRGEEGLVRPASADRRLDLMADESAQESRRITRNQDEPSWESASGQVLGQQEEETQPEADDEDPRSRGRRHSRLSRLRRSRSSGRSEQGALNGRPEWSGCRRETGDRNRLTAAPAAVVFWRIHTYFCVMRRSFLTQEVF